MSRPSRLQRQVLGLYRELLRAGRGTPGAEARVRAEFRQHARLPRADVLRIEYLYRRGRRQLQLLRSGHATAMGTFVRPRDPAEDAPQSGGDGDHATAMGTFVRPRDPAGDPPQSGGAGARSPGAGDEAPETRPDGR